jgi:hypothetical protein
MKSKIGYDIITTSLKWENEQLALHKNRLENHLKGIEVLTKEIVLTQMRIDDLEAELSEDSTTKKG